jgi:alkyl hydroperoxide reductase subunit AhpC
MIPGKVARSVFVIDAKGIIRYRDVRPLGLFRPKDDDIIEAIHDAQK